MKPDTERADDRRGAERSDEQAGLTPVSRTAILKAIADPRRFELLERIAKARCPMGCTQVGSALAISPATISHHIKELEAAGLIQVERQGKFHLLSLRPGVIESLIETLSSINHPRCDSRT
jgi:ArsR family transcriptional regulator